MSKDIVVTGATGFLGSHIVDHLRRLGHAVTAVGRRPVPFRWHDVRYLSGDIRDSHLIDEALRNASVVFHVAGNIRTPASDRAELHQEVNLDGTSVVLAAAARRRVDRLIYVSTCEVYGDAPGEQVAEDHPAAPENAYATSKWLAEEQCQQFSARGDLAVTIVRPSYIFGHGQFSQRVFPRLILAACGLAPSGEVPPTPGSGGNDYVYVRDVAEGVIYFGLQPQAATLETYNLGTGRFTLIRDVFEVVREITGYEFPESAPPTVAPARFSLSMTKAASAGYVPRFNLHNALVDFIASVRAEQSPS